MQQFKVREVAGVKPASIVRLEEEAREVIAEAQAAAEAKALAKAKAKAVDTVRGAEALERSKAKGEARTKSRLEEEARIEAAGADQWFYIQNGEQLGPVTLAEMRHKISAKVTGPSCSPF